ncbi:MAG: hypothetical protein ACR2PA_14535 [Hyphomicrobiaceae bacterium]
MKLTDAEHAIELNSTRDNLIGRTERILRHQTVRVSVGHHKSEEMQIDTELLKDIIMRVTLDQIRKIDDELIAMGFDQPDEPFSDSELRSAAAKLADA